MVWGGKVGTEVPVVALAARITRWAVGGRRYHPFVSFSASLGSKNGTERFGCMKPGRHVVRDACETQVVLWGQCGKLW